MSIGVGTVSTKLAKLATENAAQAMVDALLSDAIAFGEEKIEQAADMAVAIVKMRDFG